MWAPCARRHKRISANFKDCGLPPLQKSMATDAKLLDPRTERASFWRSRTRAFPTGVGQPMLARCRNAVSEHRPAAVLDARRRDSGGMSSGPAQRDGHRWTGPDRLVNHAISLGQLEQLVEFFLGCIG